LMRRPSRLIVVGLLIAFSAWCLVSLRADLAHMLLAPKWPSWHVLLAATALSLLNYALRIVRWRWYLGRLGHTLTWGFSALTYVAGFAFTLSPGKLGEVFRAQYYTGRGIPLRDVVSAFCVERLMDLLAMLLLAVLILTAFPTYAGVIWTALILISIGIALLMLLPWGSLASRIEPSLLMPRFLSKMGASATGALANMRPLLRPWSVIFGLLLGVGAWGMEGVGLNVLTSTFAPIHISMAVIIGIYAVSVLAGAVSLLPGGLGGTEVVMTGLLVTRGYSVTEALVLTLACRLVTLWVAIALGWLAVIALRRQRPRVVTGLQG
jgi:glycosyltransferase 2 family protein